MFRQLAEAYTRLDDDPQLRVGACCMRLATTSPPGSTCPP